MNGNIEQQILGKYANQGFSLEECTGHVTVLWFKDTMIAAFSQVAVTQQTIQDVCKRHMEKLAEVAQ